MNINDMTDGDKSVLLARLIGWLTTDKHFHSYFPPDGKGLSVNHQKGYEPEYIFVQNKREYDLYKERNFGLSWYILAYAYELGGQMSVGIELAIEKGTGANIKRLLKLPPESAQRLWLDKILSLAIEAGMIPEETE